MTTAGSRFPHDLRDRPAWFWQRSSQPVPRCSSRLALAVLALCLGAGCDGKRDPAVAPAARQMDGIEMRAAGKTANESAQEALAQRDLNTLRMVLTYVMHRAKAPLLPGSDIALIELGIHCLEAGPKAAEAAHALLDRSPASKLAVATRKACLGD